MFFFFKQKTAYEMRISDWSSDVCSSDLASDALYPAFALGKDGVAESSMSPVRFCSCGPAMTTTGPILSRRSDLTGFASTPTTYLSCLSGRSLPTRPQSAPTISPSFYKLGASPRISDEVRTGKEGVGTVRVRGWVGQ